MKKKIFKFLLLILLIILIPILILVTIFYINDKYLLNKFLNWINEAGNLSAFVISIGLYFPFINGIWRLSLNFVATLNKREQSKKAKKNKIKIYDDEKSNYIYYDPIDNILSIQFKSIQNDSIDALINYCFVETKIRMDKYKKETQEPK